jgi:HEAT repeat protein
MIIIPWVIGMEIEAKIEKGRVKKDRRLRASALRKIKSAKDKNKRLKIIKAFFSTPDPWASEVLLESLSDPNEEIRNLIIQELGRRENLDVEWVCQKLYHPHWYVKSSALKILALKKNERALFHIQTMITDPNVEVRRGIASCLGDIGGEKSLTLLMTLEKDKNRFVQTCAETAIRKISKLRFT